MNGVDENGLSKEKVNYFANNVNNANGKCLNIDHITFWVSNAKQAVSYYCVHFGFDLFAYKGLESNERDIVSHVIKQNDIYLVFTSPLQPYNKLIGEHIIKHGDGVKDIAFQVDNIDLVVKRAKQKGAEIVKDIWEESDKNGTVRMAIVRTFGDTSHTLIERKNYNGLFLPGFVKPLFEMKLLKTLPSPNLTFIDHCVASQFSDMMNDSLNWYKNSLAFHRFWSIDDAIIETEYSALKFIVVTNDSETIKLNVLEPASGKRKSQVQEYLDYYGGPGIQHIALHTDDIIKTIEVLRDRGVQFLKTPKTYYISLTERLKHSKVVVKEDLELLEKQHILLDFDDNGYLLQIFSMPVQDRPTLFFEIIQRHNFMGFGAGNFKQLFEAVEIEQAKRGNL